MKKISYDKLLNLFEIGNNVDETSFYFIEDKNKTEHYIGYLPQYRKPYWAGLCDIKDGCEFSTAEELFNAPIYNHKSIKDRWESIIICSIGGVDIEYYLL